LDRFLAAALERPRNQIQRWIRDGRVRSGGGALKASHALAGGEVLAVTPANEADRQTVEPEAGDLRLLYEDDDLAVIDKPADLAVHPGAGRASGTLAHRILARYPETAGVGGPGRPGIVHRLDKDTTGALLVARNPATQRALSEAFAERRIRKTYLAIVHGSPRLDSGSITAAIGRHHERRKEMAVRPGGRPALTHYRVLARAPGAAALEVGLETGRTHQIRVHMKYLGHPLIGDPLYGEARWRALPKTRQAAPRDFPRPALHAWKLDFRHPTSGAPLVLTAPVPEDLRTLWRALAGAELPA
jgi:23S rRNA pseudouridine1911/1915/1917 synthase